MGVCGGMGASDGKGPARTICAAALAVLLLMWPAVVNRQPIYFSDTTSYVRAADYAAHLASGGRIATIWTARYAGAAPAGGAAEKAAPGNDVASGNIMSGRSPYFGALLWASYVASGFWLFVLGQALAAFLLLRSTARLFGLGEGALLALVAALAVATGLPFYDAMLMPDALAGLGILAFLLLAIDRGRLSRGERLFAAGVLLVSAVSHLTHIAMLVGMLAALAMAAIVRRGTVRLVPALPLGAAVAAIGFASVAVTSVVVGQVFHRPPQLVPLLTARIIEDGPGRALIRSGCDFAVCALPNAARADALKFLWATDVREGVFMPADPATRARLSAEDGRFFVAAARAHPVQTLAAMARNTIQQMIDFRNGGVDQRGWDWSALPPSERARLEATAAGRGLWPVPLLDAVHYLAVAAGLVLLAAGLGRAARHPTPVGRDLALWAVLFLVAMLVNDVLGGAISIPQYRYQARLIWILPLLGLLALPLLRRRPA